MESLFCWKAHCLFVDQLFSFVFFLINFYNIFCTQSTFDQLLFATQNHRLNVGISLSLLFESSHMHLVSTMSAHRVEFFQVAFELLDLDDDENNSKNKNDESRDDPYDVQDLGGARCGSSFFYFSSIIGTGSLKEIDTF